LGKFFAFGPVILTRVFGLLLKGPLIAMTELMFRQQRILSLLSGKLQIKRAITKNKGIKGYCYKGKTGLKKGEVKVKKYNLVAQGRTADIFEWEENRVLKLYKDGFARKTAEKEFNVVRELAKKELPVPEVFELITYQKRWGVIFEKVSGPTMLEQIASNPGDIIGEARRLAELHKNFQIKVDIQLLQFKALVKKSISRVKEINGKTREKLWETLDQLTEGDKLCHGDFHPENVIIGRDKVIVIDWLTAAVGNPLADVARTSIILKLGAIPHHKSEEEIRVMKKLRDNFYKEYLKHYLKITGEDQNLIEKWEIPLAAARLEERLPLKEKRALLSFVEKCLV